MEYDLDERSLEIHELIDEWRSVAPNQPQYSRIFLLLFRASGTWLGVLEEIIDARLRGMYSEQLIQQFGKDSISILTKTLKFQGEEEILQSLLNVVRSPLEHGDECDRIDQLITLLLNQLAVYFKIESARKNRSELINRIQQRIRRPIYGDRLPKFVVFTSFVQTCKQIILRLSDTFGQAAIASHQLGEQRDKVEESLKQFKEEPNCFILICDSSGEEGRNLQFADWLIHFDLPWSPNQLEQRIGRLDRIGSKMGVKSCVFVGPYLDDSPHNTWYQLLKDGFEIFESSIASLQFYVDEKLPEIELALFQLGASKLLELVEVIRQEIADEQIKISEQNALDEIDALDETSINYFQTLDDYDACHQEIQRSTESWIYHALQFRRDQDPNLSGVLRYQPTKQTLIPVDDLKTHFALNIQQRGTYNRRIANQHSSIKVYRIGEEFVEALANYIRWDDRGQAFAMWRHDQAWDASEGMEWIGFRFNYEITTDLEPAKQALIAYKQDNYNYKALARRADALFSRC